MNRKVIQRNACIVVTYNSEVQSLKPQLRHLTSVFAIIIVVDNSTIESKSLSIKTCCDELAITHMSAHGNIGIGGAQNMALEYLQETNTNYVMFLDDDSTFNNNEIEKLIISLGMLRAEDKRIVGVGPRVVDVKTGQQLAFAWNKWLLKRVDINGDFLQTGFLVSSGSLYDYATLITEIGLLRSDYFLDGTDMELGFRIHEKGFKTIAVKNSIMGHLLGDAIEEEGNTKVNYYHIDPVRNYYQIRNALLMLRDAGMPTGRRIGRFLQISKQALVFYSYYGKNRGKRKLIVLGYVHGILGKRGQWEM